jgi:hypothetical protein
MRRLGAVLMVSAFLATTWPALAAADCGEDCSNGCEGQPAEEWAACMEPCLRACLKNDPPDVPDVPAPTPVEDEEK